MYAIRVPLAWRMLPLFPWTGPSVVANARRMPSNNTCAMPQWEEKSAHRISNGVPVNEYTTSNVPKAPLWPGKRTTIKRLMRRNSRIRSTPTLDKPHWAFRAISLQASCTNSQKKAHRLRS